MSIKNVLFKISGMHCSSCAINIDGELEDADGVVSANTNYAKQQTEVQFNADTMSEQKIIGIIKNVGYDAVLA